MKSKNFFIFYFKSLQFFRLVATKLSPEKQDALKFSNPNSFVHAYEMILTGDENGVSEADDKNTQLIVLRDNDELKRRSRAGVNDRGMVAWEMELWTPDAPHGRKIVVISNDITYQIGSFSMREHRLYYKALFYLNKKIKIKII